MAPRSREGAGRPQGVGEPPVRRKLCTALCGHRASLVAQLVKNLPTMRETLVRFLSREDPLEKAQATHSSILAWTQRVGHDRATCPSLHFLWARWGSRVAGPWDTDGVETQAEERMGRSQGRGDPRAAEATARPSRKEGTLAGRAGLAGLEQRGAAAHSGTCRSGPGRGGGPGRAATAAQNGVQGVDPVFSPVFYLWAR